MFFRDLLDPLLVTKRAVSVNAGTDRFEFPVSEWIIDSTNPVWQSGGIGHSETSLGSGSAGWFHRKSESHCQSSAGLTMFARRGLRST